MAGACTGGGRGRTACATRLIVYFQIREIEAGHEVDYKAITVLDAIRMVHSAWHHAKPETIAHCFEHAGFSVLCAQEPRRGDRCRPHRRPRIRN